MNLAPIVLFVYNRPRHTAQTIEALKKNSLASDSDLYIFCDGPKPGTPEATIQKIEEVRNYVGAISGFRSVTIQKSNHNKGLANSIIEGVTKVITEHGKAIVLEDDILTSEYFLKYMNDGLTFYEKEENVISIHAYNYPVDTTGLTETFFMRGADCWGWATWKRGWDLFEPDAKKLYDGLTSRKMIYEFDIEGAHPFHSMLEKQIAGEIDSWAIRWYASAFLRNKLTLYPKTPLIFNIGFDDSATHTNQPDSFNNKHWKSNSEIIIDKTLSLTPNKTAIKAWKNYFQKKETGFVEKILRKFLKKSTK